MVTPKNRAPFCFEVYEIEYTPTTGMMYQYNDPQMVGQWNGLVLDLPH